LQNLGSALATVTARFQSYDGAPMITLTRNVTPGRSQFMRHEDVVDGRGADARAERGFPYCS
jgi:hypothetical protein